MTCRSARTTSVSSLAFGSTGRRPSGLAWRNRIIASAVAISVFEGTTSVSTAEPPIPFSSMRVTLPPNCAATSAAS